MMTPFIRSVLLYRKGVEAGASIPAFVGSLDFSKLWNSQYLAAVV